MQQSTILIVLAVVAVLVVRRMSVLAGAILGMMVPVGVGLWGIASMNKGATIAFATYGLSRNVFLGIVGAWFVLEVLGFIRAIKQRKEPRSDY